jgi:hypothetical protein
MFAQAIIPKLSTLVKFPLTALRRSRAEKNALTQKYVRCDWSIACLVCGE